MILINKLKMDNIWYNINKFVKIDIIKYNIIQLIN